MAHHLSGSTLPEPQEPHHHLHNAPKFTMTKETKIRRNNADLKLGLIQYQNSIFLSFQHFNAQVVQMVIPRLDCVLVEVVRKKAKSSEQDMAGGSENKSKALLEAKSYAGKGGNYLGRYEHVQLDKGVQ